MFRKKKFDAPKFLRRAENVASSTDASVLLADVEQAILHEVNDWTDEEVEIKCAQALHELYLQAQNFVAEIGEWQTEGEPRLEMETVGKLVGSSLAFKLMFIEMQTRSKHKSSF